MINDPATAECALPAQKAGRMPATASFMILLITLWALNLADIFQTVYLKESGFLAQEANYFVDFFLREGRAVFFFAKVLALILITSMLCRGWFDKHGLKLGTIFYPPDQVRKSIHLLLVSGVIYYTLIVGFPFFAMLIAGMFASPEQPPL